MCGFGCAFIVRCADAPRNFFAMSGVKRSQAWSMATGAAGVAVALGAVFCDGLDVELDDDDPHPAIATATTSPAATKNAFPPRCNTIVSFENSMQRKRRLRR